MQERWPVITIRQEWFLNGDKKDLGNDDTCNEVENDAYSDIKQRRSVPRVTKNDADNDKNSKKGDNVDNNDADDDTNKDRDTNLNSDVDNQLVGEEDNDHDAENDTEENVDIKEKNSTFVFISSSNKNNSRFKMWNN